ncbi:MAG: ATP-binding protein [Acidobacteria bacterium]|nr:ATP-binding protein [Acidobacteriota bacterium]
MSTPTIIPRQAPPLPRTIEETGISQELLIQLLIKTLYLMGELTEATAADRLKLPFALVGELLQIIRNEKMCEIKGSGGSMLYRYAITDFGTERAREYMHFSQYVGPAPVSLAQYTAVMLEQTVLDVHVSREMLEQATDGMVIPMDTLEQVGEAINSGQPMFIYGEPGNGKTMIAEALGRMLRLMRGGEVYVPYAVDVDNQIIQVFDPVTHTRMAREESDEVELVPIQDEFDSRWVPCQRPIVFTGGELTLKMLDLSFNTISKYYEAPPQMKANSGVFIIDDFGRQMVRPRDLLNRWIVPLEKRVDYLTLHTGKKFPVPFDTIVLFATNIPPRKLADEAFLRRIRNKINIMDPTPENYAEIFRKYCTRKGVPFDPAGVVYIFDEYYSKHSIKPRGCHPRDIIEQILSTAKYLEQPPTLSKSLIDRACHIYFLKDT